MIEKQHILLWESLYGLSCLFGHGQKLKLF